MQDLLEVPEKDRDQERIIGIVFDISPAQAAVVSCLCRSQVLTGQEILEFTGAKSQIKSTISHTRSRLREFGLDIKSKPEVGYWMTADDKRAVGKMVQDFLEDV